MKLYAAQQAAVDKFLATPEPHKLLVAADTGTGKTPISIESLRALPRGRTLVVCPAVGRRHWEKEFSVWWPERLPVGVIEWGRERKSLTVKSLEERDLAYQNETQIVSFDLVKEVTPTGWTNIVLDEVHHLQHPTSAQSKLIRTMVRANPTANVLMLSATSIPTEVRGLWHPLHLAWPADWGGIEKNGKESYKFLNAYCNRELTDAGYQKWFGLREDKREELERRLQPYVARITREDIRADLSPIDVSGLYGSETARLDAVASDWAAELGEAVTHFGVFTYHRELAESVAERLAGQFKNHRVACVHGEMDSTARYRLLDTLSQEPRAILVGTTESLRESIRLMWVQHALVLEWRKSPSQVVQFLGRFGSVGYSGVPPCVRVLITPNQVEAARQLMQRMADINSLLKASESDAAIGSVFAERERSADEMDAMFERMLSGMSLERLAWEGDADE